MVDQLFLTIDEFNHLIKQWQGQPIKITKFERDDLDETFIDLGAISYHQHPGTVDDYQAKYTMQFDGAGQVITDNNTSRPLPGNQYAIPLEDNTLYEYDGREFIISTERGVYKIIKDDG